jgi:hypothetical protein
MDYYCSICKEAISEQVQQYSMNRFGKALCIEHQKTALPKKQYFCSECKKTITHEEFKFSLRNFDKPLCRDCQPEIEEKVSAAPRKFPGTYKIEVNERHSEKKTQGNQN